VPELSGFIYEFRQPDVHFSSQSCGREDPGDECHRVVLIQPAHALNHGMALDLLLRA
jgi:hypothetical protein